MKRLLSILFCIFTVQACYSQGTFRYCTNINGIWDTWKNSYTVYMSKIQNQEFIIYFCDNHPSDYIMRFKVYGQMYDNDKKSRKRHIKNKEWYQLKGEVEIFTDTETFAKKFPFVASHNKPEMKNVKVPATIGIEPYKTHPVTLNIWFDGYGIGLAGGN